MKREILILTLSLLLFSCTQEPAVIESRGEVSYSFDSDKWHRIAQKESPRNFKGDEHLGADEVKEVEMKPLVKEVLQEQELYKKEPQSKQAADAAVIASEQSLFTWPVQGDVISKFGTDAKGMKHDGINIEVAKGTNVKAARAGTVVYAGNELTGYGNLVIVKHDNGWLSAYGHLEKMDVKKGMQVKDGQSLGAVGQSGNVETPQLHFALRKAGKNPVDPLKYLPNKSDLNI